jgi:hypothetical protein
MIDLKTILPILVNSEIEFVIVGGVAATIHGSSYVTDDLDICYGRSQANLRRIAEALNPYQPRLRGAPEGLPFIWDAKTLQNGLNFTLRTGLGDIDLLGEIAGVGSFDQARTNSVSVKLFEVECLVLSLDKLIDAKRAAGRQKDKLMLPELEALREATQDSE